MQMEEALDRCEYALRYQQDEIARLRAELERRNEELTQLLAWINGDSDALVVLQRTYMDPRTSTSDQIKACAAAVGYERTKFSVQLRVGPSVLGERLAQARAIKVAEPKTIEHQIFFWSTYRMASLAKATMRSILGSDQRSGPRPNSVR